MFIEPPSSIRWLFLDLNSYFASVEQQLQPELRGKPVAVVPMETESTCAIAASYEAKAFGVRTGTRIYDAMKMCPQLICVPARHEHYVAFHHNVLAAIERHIPVTDIASIDEMACELDASECNVEAATALAHRIKKEIHVSVGDVINCSIGIAPNRFLAKIATELEKPDGLVIIHPHDIPQKLFTLSFDDIPGIGRGMQHRLYKAGISTIDQLYGLQPKQMRALWHSVSGERMYYKLRGIDIAHEQTQKRTVGHSHVIAPQQRHLTQARLIGQRLLIKAVSRMRRYGYGTTRMHVSLRIEHGERLGRELHFSAATDHVQLLQYFDAIWCALTEECSSHARVKKISVTLFGLVADAQQQGDLFSQETLKQAHDKSDKNNRLSEVMDTLNQRYGRNTVTLASSLGDPSTFTGTKIAFSRIPDTREFNE